jgi:hypothetical protein
MHQCKISIPRISKLLWIKLTKRVVQKNKRKRVKKARKKLLARQSRQNWLHKLNNFRLCCSSSSLFSKKKIINFNKVGLAVDHSIRSKLEIFFCYFFFNNIYNKITELLSWLRVTIRVRVSGLGYVEVCV